MKTTLHLLVILVICSSMTLAGTVAIWSFDDAGAGGNANLSAATDPAVTASEIRFGGGYKNNSSGWTDVMAIQDVDGVEYTYIDSTGGAAAMPGGKALAINHNLAAVGDWPDGTANGGRIQFEGDLTGFDALGSTESGSGGLYLWSQCWKQNTVAESLDQGLQLEFSLTGVGSCMLKGFQFAIARETDNAERTWEDWHLLADLDGDGFEAEDEVAWGETTTSDLDNWQVVKGDMDLYLVNGQTINFALVGRMDNNHGQSHLIILDDISFTGETRVAGNPEPKIGSDDHNPEDLNDGSSLSWVLPDDPDITGSFITLDTDPNLAIVSTGIKDVLVDGTGAVSFDPGFEFELGQTIYWQIETQIKNQAAGDPNNVLGGVWTFKTAVAAPKVVSFENVITAQALAPAVLTASIFDFDHNVSTVAFSSTDADVVFANQNEDLYTPRVEVVSNQDGDHFFDVLLTVTDTEGNVTEATASVAVYATTCGAAQALPNWAGFNYMDRSEPPDCIVDLSDFMALAMEWLDDRTLKAQMTY